MNSSKLSQFRARKGPYYTSLRDSGAISGMPSGDADMPVASIKNEAVKTQVDDVDENPVHITLLPSKGDKIEMPKGTEIKIFGRNSDPVTTTTASRLTRATVVKTMNHGGETYVVWESHSGYRGARLSDVTLRNLSKKNSAAA